MRLIKRKYQYTQVRDERYERWLATVENYFTRNRFPNTSPWGLPYYSEMGFIVKVEQVNGISWPTIRLNYDETPYETD